MIRPEDFISAPDIPGAPGSKDSGKPAEDPGSFTEFGDDAKDAGKAVAKDTAGTARDEGIKEGAALANDVIEDAKVGKAPDPKAILERAGEVSKRIAHDSGEAGIETAKTEAQQQVDKALAIIGNEFPVLGGILGLLSKPIVDRALDECKMPDF